MITGACGYVGRLVVAELARTRRDGEVLIAADVVTPSALTAEVEHLVVDVRDPGLPSLMVARGHGGDPPRGHRGAGEGAEGAALAYAVDVEGTRNVLAGCVACGARKIVISSSGAAYGYHADNDALLTEDSPLRGNDAFPYSRHKRLVEELLAAHRVEHPALGQLVFRLCSVLGAGVHTPITALFERPVILGLSDAATPFCFVWDEDVVACLVAGARDDHTGIYNLAGDGVMTLREIAHALGKRYVAVPARALEAGLGVLRRLGLTAYGPEQVRFLRYRPVLGSARARVAFPGRRLRTSREVFELYRRSHG
ncbi:MAG: NAD-dependent epimerase/dehydratase family protein [bacterium]